MRGPLDGSALLQPPLGAVVLNCMLALLVFANLRVRGTGAGARGLPNFWPLFKLSALKRL